MTNFEKILKVFENNGIEYILIGGFAGVVYGSSRLTRDVDFVYNRSPENIKKIVDALEEFHPYLRGAPPGLPFLFDSSTLEQECNSTLTTDIGGIDLLGEIPGGNFDSLKGDVVLFDVNKTNVRVISLIRLIQLKRASGMT